MNRTEAFKKITEWILKAGERSERELRIEEVLMRVQDMDLAALLIEIEDGRPCSL